MRVLLQLNASPLYITPWQKETRRMIKGMKRWPLQEQLEVADLERVVPQREDELVDNAPRNPCVDTGKNTSCWRERAVHSFRATIIIVVLLAQKRPCFDGARRLSGENIGIGRKWIGRCERVLRQRSHAHHRHSEPNQQDEHDAHKR